MAGSILKYFSNDGGGRRTPDGYPIRQSGPAGDLRNDELDEIELSVDVRVEVLKTNNPEELAKYITILDKISNGLFCRVDKDRVEFLPDEKAWIIMIQYGEIKGDVPPDILRRVGNYS
jgi:hypothetical protein